MTDGRICYLPQWSDLSKLSAISSGIDQAKYYIDAVASPVSTVKKMGRSVVTVGDYLSWIPGPVLGYLGMGYFAPLIGFSATMKPLMAMANTTDAELTKEVTGSPMGGMLSMMMSKITPSSYSRRRSHHVDLEDEEGGGEEDWGKDVHHTSSHSPPISVKQREEIVLVLDAALEDFEDDATHDLANDYKNELESILREKNKRKTSDVFLKIKRLNRLSEDHLASLYKKLEKEDQKRFKDALTKSLKKVGGILDTTTHLRRDRRRFKIILMGVSALAGFICLWYFNPKEFEYCWSSVMGRVFPPKDLGLPAKLSSRAEKTLKQIAPKSMSVHSITNLWKRYTRLMKEDMLGFVTNSVMILYAVAFLSMALAPFVALKYLSDRALILGLSVAQGGKNALNALVGIGDKIQKDLSDLPGQITKEAVDLVAKLPAAAKIVQENVQKQDDIAISIQNNTVAGALDPDQFIAFAAGDLNKGFNDGFSIGARTLQMDSPGEPMRIIEETSVSPSFSRYLPKKERSPSF